MSCRYLPSAPLPAGQLGQETCGGFYSYLWSQKTNLFELPSLPIQWKSRILFLNNQKESVRLHLSVTPEFKLFVYIPSGKLSL